MVPVKVFTTIKFEMISSNSCIQLNNQKSNSFQQFWTGRIQRFHLNQNRYLFESTADVSLIAQ